MSLTRALFEAVGGLDESLRSGYEDLELGRRLDQHGMRLVYEPRAIARHLHRHDWEAIIARFRAHAEGERADGEPV